MSLVRSPIVWLAIAVAGAGLGLLLLLRQGHAPILGTGEAVATAPVVRNSSATTTVADPVIDRLASPGDVEGYLGKLMVDAKERGVIGPADFALGRHAIERLRGRIADAEVQARARRFGEELSLMQHALAHAPVVAELDELATRIAGTADHAARSGLSSQYRASVQRLPLPAQRDALARLANVASRSRR